ncbi:MAG TPA: bile acid:sodium symporter family protein [Dokdonella sp.]|uniref:bile acid:sodium symporter family protein n=1 Tax=Dokdonella sp. TaxID=2291710 RepID=UPI002C32078A|nr:bile acid:sodium symporter family protein [Dokdonella sp.]HUD40499.1 bile acid:sodium symporter family protein [Dokdonella sp.]
MKTLRSLLDGFTLALIGTVVLASLWPCEGAAAVFFDRLTVAGIALLFFLHGARLSREAIVAGLLHWRLHLVVLAATFVVFPLVGLAFRPLAGAVLPAGLVFGLMYLCCLPSTVQSSIAFTAIARGNVPAAVCSASASNLLGVFATPLLVALLLGTPGGDGDSGSPLEAIGDIVLQLLVPFVAGHLLRPWVGRFVERHRRVLGQTDRGTVLLVVYVAFSESVVEGLWHHVPPPALAILAACVLALLTLMLVLTTLGSRALGFSKEDEITIVFCGTKKSLATGVPMAKILFAGNPALGMIVLPIMLFHQVQLMACAWLAQRYARRPADAAQTAASGDATR